MSEQGPDLQLSPGDIIFMSAHSVANPGFVAPASDSSFEDDAMQTFEDCFGTEPGELAAPGFPTADSILVLSVEQDLTFIGVRLGVMSTDPVANHLPELADKLTKPKVFFIGGENQPVVLGVGYLSNPIEADEAKQKINNGVPLFGKGHQFLHIRTGDPLQSVEQQIAAAGNERAGMRLFHSFVTGPVAHVKQWKQAGFVEVEQAEFADVFTEKPVETWRQIMARRPFPENLFSTWAQNPERN